MWSYLETCQIFLSCYAVSIYSCLQPLPKPLTSFVLQHPIESVLCAYAVAIVAIAYAPPKSQLRLFVIPVIAAIVGAYLETAHIYISNKSLIAFSSGPTTLLLFAGVDFLNLQRLYLKSDGKERALGPEEGKHQKLIERTKKPLVGEANGVAGKPADGVTNGAANGAANGVLDGSLAADTGTSLDFVRRVRWGTDVFINYRAVNTPREVKNCPKFSKTNPAYVPTRARFLLQRGAAVITVHLILDFLNNQPPPDLKMFAVEKGYQFLWLLSLSSEDIITRALATVIFLFSLRQTIALFYNFFNFLFVLVGFSPVEDWPPYFGSVLSASTVRKFWSNYWYLALRNMLTGNAKFWTHGIFRAKKGTIIARYLNILLTFTISGILHTILDRCGGVPAGETWAYDGVIEVYRRLTNSPSTVAKGSEQKTVPLWQKIIGYLWVFIFEVWVTPAWTYANIRHADPERSYLLPFSVVKWIQAKAV